MKEEKTICQQVRDLLIEQYSTEIMFGLTLLSERKKKKIRKWVHNALLKQKTLSEKAKGE